MADRVRDIDASTQYGDGRPASRQRRAVCGAVDTARHPADDADSRVDESARQRSGRTLAVRCRAPSSDDRDARTIDQVELTDDEQKRWRVAEVAEVPGVVGVIEQHETRAAPLSVARDAHRFGAKALSIGAIDRRSERVGGGTEPGYALAVRPRADARREREGERVDTTLGGTTLKGAAPLRVVVPPLGAFRGAAATTRRGAARVRCARRR
jgi:hypothetical protein